VVEIATLTPRPVDDSTEYVATIRSRGSTEVRPEVEGVVRRIFVASGARVAAGAPLIQIDPAKQSAAAASDAAAVAAQQADLQWARSELERSKQLAAEGVISKQQLDRAEMTVQNAEARLRSLRAQEQESAVQLQYYRVTAPTAGVVGDIPIRVGDRVTNSTVLTTIDQNAGLEAYIPVPVERAPDLKTGLPVRLVDDRGQVVADTSVSFVSPQVDDRMQSVLVKAPVPSDRGFRNSQFVRAQIVWRTEPRLLLPTIAVARINGRHFAYVAEGGKNGPVARMRPVTLGRLTGNDYVLLDGIKQGERVVVAGTQKLTDNAPIQEKSNGM
jgi:RND family efflux transporter MFP subunit